MSSRSDLVAVQSTWRCPLCYTFASKNLKGVVRHIGSVHAVEANFQVVCGVEGCPRTYKHYHSYRRHLYKKHREILEIEDHATTLSGAEALDVGSEGDLDSGSVSNFEGSCEGRNYKREAALFLMKARTLSKMSNAAIDSHTEDVTLLLGDRIQSLQDDLTDILKQRGLEMDAELASVFQKENLTAPFHGLHSAFLRDAFYVEEMGLLKPIERKLGEKVLKITKDSRPCLKRQIDYMYEVPLLLSLKQLLSDPFILDEVLRGHQHPKQMLADYCDGTHYRSHPLFSEDKKFLQIILYYDDVEICNPLGSSAKKHKLALFYYTLGNISPLYRSALKCIQLLAVTKSSVLQSHGADKVLENFMEDIKQLESGVTFELGGEEYFLRGTISLVPGDNLASQYLGGYKGLSSALRKCRQCMAVDDDMQLKFVSEAFEPRTRSTHATHTTSLHGPLRDHYATTFGIARNSILNTSSYFHVTEGLVPDVMHDLLEGVLPLETKELIRHLIGTGSVRLSQLNDRMQTFPYSGSDATNKPIPISPATISSRDHLLKQKATQMWCLGRLLPLMIADKINPGDQHWENFLLLLTIVNYCMAPIVSEDWIAYLRMIISDHHTQFKALYPTVRLTPKMHYLVHFPDIMSKYGPLLRFWCMRFEGKHNFFKDIAHRVKGYKNIAKTMAERHQESACYSRNSSQVGSQYCKQSKTGPVRDSLVSILEYKDVILQHFPSITEESNVQRLSWVEIKGTTYKLGSVVVLSMNLVPTFGIIRDIFVFSTDMYYLLCEVFFTECFSHHFHAYQVCKQMPIDFLLCKQSELHDHTVLECYTVSSQPNSFYVPLKYQIIEY